MITLEREQPIMVHQADTRTDEEESIGSPPFAESIDLSPDILILHFIATGVIQLAECVARGTPIDSHYPAPLQIGLNRLNVIRYRHGLPLIRSVPALLSWCRRPFKEWPLDIALAHLDPDDTLLDDQFPTSVCEALACATSDVEADLSERKPLSRRFGLPHRLLFSHVASGHTIASVGTSGSHATPAPKRLVSSPSSCSGSQKALPPGSA